MKNILITGGAGFIGSHTVVELVNAGFNPIIVDNLSNSDKSVLDNIAKITQKQISFYEHDYQDTEFLSDLLRKEDIAGVIHFAAYRAVGESVQQPLKYYTNNVAGLISLIGVMDECGVRDLIFSSSCTVYGEPDKLPVDEDAPIKPAVSPYGSSKQFCETIIKDACQAGILRSISLRYFNAIGAHPSGHIGELPIGIPANLVPFITQTAAGWRQQLTIYGNDYPTDDGTCVRDYIHVVDVAKAHVKALSYTDDKPLGYYDVFNLGTGRGNSVLEVIHAFEKVSQKKVAYEIGPRRKGDVAATYASVDKANDLLDWHTEKSLDDALLDAWRWQQNLNN